MENEITTIKVFDRGVYKLAKPCLNCGRLFTDRKKYQNFEEVKYCSQKCKLEARKTRLKKD